jgi:hypothetical protein
VGCSALNKAVVHFFPKLSLSITRMSSSLISDTFFVKNNQMNIGLFMLKREKSFHAALASLLNPMGAVHIST